MGVSHLALHSDHLLISIAQPLIRLEQMMPSSLATHWQLQTLLRAQAQSKVQRLTVLQVSIPVQQAALSVSIHPAI